MAKRTPHLWRNVFTNFINSFKGVTKPNGKLVGEDYLGNRYFEIPADPSVGKRKPSRWFTPTSGEAGFDQEMPAEWESWLRFRRSEPPALEEIEHNLAIIKLKQQNSALLEAKASSERLERGVQLKTDDKGLYSYPKYTDYEQKDK